jgi:hypothetical protein
MELLSGHEKIIPKSGISLNVETLNLGFTLYNRARENLPAQYREFSSSARQRHKMSALWVWKLSICVPMLPSQKLIQPLPEI